MATLSDIINKLGGGIVYDERTKRFHDLTANYKMVSSEQALRQTTPGRPSRDGMTTQYVTQTSFDALRRDVYAMMSSIAQNAYIASNELRKSLEAQRKDTESLRKYENQVNEDRLEGIPRPGMMERIGGIAGAVGRGTRRAIGIAPYAIGGLGLAGLAAALAATLLNPETVRELDEAQREIQSVVSGVSRLATDIYNLRSEILLMAEIAGTVIGGLLGIRAINRFANRAAGRIQGSSAYQRMSSALQRMFNFNRAPPTPPATPSTSPSSAARPPAAANMNQPSARQPPGPAQSSVPRPGNMERPPPAPANDPNRGGSRLAPQPGQPSPPPPERVQTPAPGNRAPTSGSPRRIPGAGIARFSATAAGVALGLIPSIVYYATTTREERQVTDIEELGENTRQQALTIERTTLELNRLQRLPQENPARNTTLMQTQRRLIRDSRNRIDNNIRSLERLRREAQARIPFYERSIATERSNPYGINQEALDTATNELERHRRRLGLIETYLDDSRGLRLMINNPELIREMPSSETGTLTEEQRQQAVIALGQGSLTSERLAAMAMMARTPSEGGSGAIVLPPIIQRIQRQMPTAQPAQPTGPAGGPGGQQARPGANPLPGSAGAGQ
jgi:hypothetical protein